MKAFDGTIVLSGVTLVAPAFSLDDTLLLGPVPAQPYLGITGTDGPGGERRVLVYGPAGAPFLLLTSLVEAFTPWPGVEGLVWLDPLAPFQAVVLTAAGQDVAEAFLVPLPAGSGLEGITLTTQAVFPQVAGALDPAAVLVTNPASIVLR